ncbi:hypothetical protein HWC34_gp11 [Microbacterium phage Alex44]|uniref:Uncharacterized protein n=2 Tax=Tinytimothyvirus alex44 TaxID=2845588 RepID=A0A6M3T3X5_9CAUD|nr:hypothetical protein HWC34_gp11 [Microbacterium phage Alex44]QDF15921.1 hypothetical protein SEA_ALEX44_11 [Microbacterium phage Alex44]QJD52809.1 hypothetical protein SEA_PHOGO_11 [Microbacterium phage Phogo]
MADKLKGIRELREMPVIVREGYFATLSVADRLKLMKRFSASNINLGLIEHANNVSMHMLANPSKDAIYWYEEGVK